ncbi:FadR/GntR family transcriptional regulator [Azospirillum halopraeferens]|uniref:FadR/GntR family transcriptional regulator n=1 Tax=Azospirillum halopraeferens TaxID=34010 RepID=UPI00048D64F5|nr:FCD domain-containing protein [Azospirillum halopraeferens]
MPPEFPSRDVPTASGLTPIARQQVPEMVARQIQQLIARQSLATGDRLATERDLAEALQVSRAAVREGLKLLAGYGVVEVRPNVGIFVREPQRLVLLDPSSLGSEERRRMLVQATAVRSLIDCEAAELAARIITDDELEGIRRYLTEADSEPMRTRLAFAIDLNFEAMIGAAAGNPYLAAVQRDAHRYFRSAWESCGFIPRPADDRSAQHWGIFEAIAARDARRARTLMFEHMQPQSLSGGPIPPTG